MLCLPLAPASRPQPVRSFKVRGAYNKMSRLPKEQLERGVICSSAGNHAQVGAGGGPRPRRLGASKGAQQGGAGSRTRVLRCHRVVLRAPSGPAGRGDGGARAGRQGLCVHAHQLAGCAAARAAATASALQALPLRSSARRRRVLLPPPSQWQRSPHDSSAARLSAEIKINAVKELGGTVELVGESFLEAQQVAQVGTQGPRCRPAGGWRGARRGRGRCEQRAGCPAGGLDRAAAEARRRMRADASRRAPLWSQARAEREGLAFINAYDDPVRPRPPRPLAWRPRLRSPLGLAPGVTRAPAARAVLPQYTIAGQGTIGTEILHQTDNLEGVDYIFVAIGAPPRSWRAAVALSGVMAGGRGLHLCGHQWVLGG